MTRRLAAAAAAVVCSAAVWSAAPAGASTTWRVQQVPAPANGTGQLRAVSCPAADVCFAVGWSDDLTTGARSLLAERRAGGQWVIQPIPTPAGSPFGEFSAISCLSVTDCIAIGAAGTQTEATGTLVEHWDGTSWTIMPSPDTAGGPPDFGGLSCASDTSCTAVGLDFSIGSRPHEVPVAAHWDGAAWTVTHPPLPAGIALGDLEGGVSCPSATDCIAVGSGATADRTKNETIAERWNGTRWSVQAILTPAGSHNANLDGVSCTSPKHCTAVGAYFAHGGTMETALVERWDGTAWTIQDDSVLRGDTLVAVSCTSSTSCTAIGQGFEPTAEHWDGTTWTVQPMPVPHQTTRPVTATGVSCVLAASCTAVGYYGRKGRPLAEHE